MGESEGRGIGQVVVHTDCQKAKNVTLLLAQL